MWTWWLKTNGNMGYQWTKKEHLNSEEWIFSQNSVDLNGLYVNQSSVTLW
jgi:hypothetical protein